MENSTNSPETERPAEHDPNELIVVVDRKGNKQEMTRAEFEARKRRKRKRERTPTISFQTTFSMLFIIAVIFISALIALKIVE